MKCQTKFISSCLLFLFSFSLVLALSLSLPSPAYALDSADNVSISNPFVFTYLIEENDFLVVVPYAINFTTNPSQPISSLFTFRLFDSDGLIELGSILAYPYYQNGYGAGVTAFYFDASDAPAWEGAYIIRIEENPIFYASPQSWSFVLSPSDYSEFTTQDDNRQLLKDKILEIAVDLELTFPVDLRSQEETGTYLSIYGENYFRGAIRGIQSMCPQLFLVQVREITYTKRSWSTAFAESFTTQYDGTWVGRAMTGAGGLFELEPRTATGFFIGILAVVALALSFRQHKQIMPAFLDIFVILILGTLLGGFSFILLGLIAFVSVAIAGVILFLNRA